MVESQRQLYLEIGQQFGISSVEVEKIVNAQSHMAMLSMKEGRTFVMRKLGTFQLNEKAYVYKDSNIERREKSKAKEKEKLIK